MTVPAAPLEAGGRAILFTLDDNAGTNRANLLRGYKGVAINAERVAALGVYPVSGDIENGNMQLTAGTALALSSTSIPCQGLIVKARAANTATIYVGKSDVTADTTNATGGYPLEPGESVGVPCSNVNTVFIRGTSGDGVAWLASID